MKYFVTGSAGLVGSQVINDLTQQHHTVFASYLNEIPEYGVPVKLDLTDNEKIRKTVREVKPERIIHLGAMTNVDLCEVQPDLAMMVNTTSTKILAQEAEKLKAFFVYVSTDYVFDGKHSLNKENDSPNPVGVYGKTKLDGEKSLNNLSSGYGVARTSTPFGIHKTKKSFPLWIIENLKSKKKIPVLDDQFTSPTYVPNLSKMLIEIATSEITGTIHVSGATRISRFQFAEMIAEELNLDKTLLEPTKLKEMKWKSARPKDSSLDVTLATEILQEKPYTIQKSLPLFINEIIH